MSDNHEKIIAFKKEEAIQLIIAAIQAGAISFPFSKSLNDEKINNLIKSRMSSCLDNLPRAELLRRIEGVTIAAECAALARRDALFILTLLTTLTHGITEEEAQRIIRTATD